MEHLITLFFQKRGQTVSKLHHCGFFISCSVIRVGFLGMGVVDQDLGYGWVFFHGQIHSCENCCVHFLPSGCGGRMDRVEMLDQKIIILQLRQLIHAACITSMTFLISIARCQP